MHLKPGEPEEEVIFIPVMETDEHQVHTPEHPFCDDMTCPCHEDKEAIHELGEYYQDGLVSASDADNIYHGKTI